MSRSKSGQLNTLYRSTETSTHHLSVLWGEDHQAVQRNLLAELKRTYSGSERIDVTVLRMEEVTLDVDAQYFEGCFTP